MLRLIEVVRGAEGEPAAGVLTMPFDERRKSRLRGKLDDGREVALLLPRGTVLRDGDRLRAESGEIVVVRAAAQTLSVARTGDGLLLARAAYHLGNRHVPVEVHAGGLAYEHDHVLDGLVAELGLTVETAKAPFEPEAGGYGHAGTAGGSETGSGRGGHRHEH